MRRASHDLRTYLHGGIHWMIGKLAQVDELVDAHPLVGLETAFGVMRYVRGLLGGGRADASRADMN